MALDLTEALDWAGQHRHAVLITTKRDGSPQSSDVVYTVSDDALTVSLTDSRAKTVNIRRDPRIVLHVTRPDTWSYVSFSGDADLTAVTVDPHDSVADQLVSYYEAVAGQPHDNWEEYRAAMVSEGQLLMRLRPTRAVGQIQTGR